MHKSSSSLTATRLLALAAVSLLPSAALAAAAAPIATSKAVCVGVTHLVL